MAEKRHSKQGYNFDYDLGHINGVLLPAYRNLMTRDASGTREPEHRWEPGTGTQVGPKIFSDLKFELFLTC